MILLPILFKLVKEYGFLPASLIVLIFLYQITRATMKEKESEKSASSEWMIFLSLFLLFFVLFPLDWSPLNIQNLENAEDYRRRLSYHDLLPSSLHHPCLRQLMCCSYQEFCGDRPSSLSQACLSDNCHPQPLSQARGNARAAAVSWRLLHRCACDL